VCVCVCVCVCFHVSTYPRVCECVSGCMRVRVGVSVYVRDKPHLILLHSLLQHKRLSLLRHLIVGDVLHMSKNIAGCTQSSSIKC
jgi:hypothetical protein